MPTSEETLLAVNSVSVFYGDIQVIFDLSIEVRVGEIVTLIGSNGSGKTTMVNTISGVLKPRSGGIYYRGESTLKTPAHKLVEQGLIQVPEGRLLFSARHNPRERQRVPGLRGRTARETYDGSGHFRDRSDERFQRR